MNWDFFSHILRDVFTIDGFVIYFGDDRKFIETIRKPEHGVEAFMMHADASIPDDDHCHLWSAPGINGHYFGPQSCDLLISVDYNPRIDRALYMAGTIRDTMRPNGKVVLVNPGYWAQPMSYFMKQNDHLVDELKRYSMLRDERVYVYESL